MAKLLIATADAFTKAGRFVAAGQTASADEVDWEEGTPGFIEAPSGVDGNAVVEVAAIAPTGPNPTNPQQIAPDVVQTSAGYVQAGATLVGEVTQPEKQRIKVRGIDKDDDTQAKVTQALADAPSGTPATGVDPLDHDGDGKKGGTKKPA